MYKTMKKFLLPMLATFVLLCGCSEKARVITSYYTVNPNQWEASITTYNDGTYITNYYYSQWENVDITPDVIDNGVVLVYYLNEDGYDQLLPYTQYFQGTDDDGETIHWSTRMEYDIQNGVITFVLKDSDFNTAQTMSNLGTLKFKVSVIRNM